MRPPFPVTVIGGYLGSGKTTLINHLLRHAKGLRLAVMVNDFGDLAIDEDLIEATGDDIISIAGGCVCCSFGSDLSAALMALTARTPRPDHILIESSGVAIPGAIAASVSLLPGFRSDGIVVLADAETIRDHAADQYMGDTVTRQLEDADIVLLTKADLVSPEVARATMAWLRGRIPAAPVIETRHGKVPPETVLDSFLEREHQAGKHSETVTLDVMTLRPRGPLDPDQLARMLAVGGLGIVRAKGFVIAPDGRKVLVQVVGARWQTSTVEGDPGEGTQGVVCLGFRGVLNRGELEKLA